MGKITLGINCCRESESVACSVIVLFINADNAYSTTAGEGMCINELACNAVDNGTFNFFIGFRYREIRVTNIIRTRPKA